jgi:hypothetical protein
MASSSTNMSLTLWNSLSDYYDSSQLVDNFNKIDLHDHTSGKGVKIPTAGIVDGAITGGTAGSGVKIAANTITAANIAQNGVAIDETNIIPAARIKATSQQDLTGSATLTYAAVNMDTIDIDTGVSSGYTAMADVTSTGPKGKIYARVAGIYFISFMADFNQTANAKSMQILSNNTTVIAANGFTVNYTTGVQTHMVSGVISLSVGDYISAKVASYSNIGMNNAIMRMAWMGKIA